MKTIKKVIAVFALTLATVPAMAQMNIGHCSVDSVLAKMPEYQTAMAELEALSTELQSILDDEQADIQAAAQNLEANRGTWTQLRITAAEQRLQEDVRTFQQNTKDAQATLSQREAQLLNPIITKLQATINVVGEENGYDYILDSTPGRSVVIFKTEEHDISELVLKEMGL